MPSRVEASPPAERSGWLGRKGMLDTPPLVKALWRKHNTKEFGAVAGASAGFLCRLDRLGLGKEDTARWLSGKKPTILRPQSLRDARTVLQVAIRGCIPWIDPFQKEE